MPKLHKNKLKNKKNNISDIKIQLSQALRGLDLMIGEVLGLNNVDGIFIFPT